MFCLLMYCFTLSFWFMIMLMIRIISHLLFLVLRCFFFRYIYEKHYLLVLLIIISFAISFYLFLKLVMTSMICNLLGFDISLSMIIVYEWNIVLISIILIFNDGFFSFVTFWNSSIFILIIGLCFFIGFKEIYRNHILNFMFSIYSLIRHSLSALFMFELNWVVVDFLQSL